MIGRTVTVYSLTSDPGGANRDFVDGEKLALADAGGRAGALAVNFTSLDLGGSDDRLQAQAARRAISDPQIIAAIVDATKVTVPLFNAAGILQVAASGDPSLAADPQALPVGQAHRRHAADRAAARRLRGAASRRSSGATPRRPPTEGYRAMKGVLDGDRRRGRGRQRPHPRASTTVLPRYTACT